MNVEMMMQLADWLGFGVVLFALLAMLAAWRLDDEKRKISFFFLVCVVFAGCGMTTLKRDAYRLYRDDCFKYMAATPPSQWSYENPRWKVFRVGERVFCCVNDFKYYEVEPDPSGGFFVKDEDSRIAYAVTKDGKVMDFRK